MRIATWNLRENMGAGAWPRLWDTLGLNILFLQESAQPQTNDPHHWELVDGIKWGSAVVLSSGRIEPIAIPDYRGWVVGGEVVGGNLPMDDRRLFAFSLHSPRSSNTAKRQSYVKEVDAVITILKSPVVHSECDLMIGGDFNFTIGERQPGEFRETKNSEREVIQRMAEFGLSSCWSMSHPDLPLEQTLRWVSDRAPHKSTPFHCDGIFVPHRWKDKTSCEVFTSACYRISDHNPVVAWIGE
jgi:hypothetical protein